MRNLPFWILLALAALSAALLVVVYVADAQEALPLPVRPTSCQVVIRAPAWPPAEGYTRPDWPASGWLQPHEASGAQDLGETPEGDHLWRVLLTGRRCEGVERREGYVALVLGFTPVAFPVLAVRAWKMEVDRTLVDKDGVAQKERLSLGLDKVDGKTDVALGAPYLPGGFSGVGLDDAKER